MTEIIGRTYVTEGNIEGYSALPESIYSCNWIVEGGKIVKGQGTQAISVQWHSTGFGSIELDTLTAEGDADALYITIEVGKYATYNTKELLKV